MAFPGGWVVKNPPANAEDTSSIWEGPTWLRESKPVATTIEPVHTRAGSCSYWAHVSHCWSLDALAPVLCKKRSYCNEKSANN